MSYVLDTTPLFLDFGHGMLCLCPTCVDQYDAALQMWLSGTYRGVDWRIVPEIRFERMRYALYVADEYVASADNRSAAVALMREWIDDLVEQGLTGDSL